MTVTALVYENRHDRVLPASKSLILLSVSDNAQYVNSENKGVTAPGGECKRGPQSSIWPGGGEPWVWGGARVKLPSPPTSAIPSVYSAHALVYNAHMGLVTREVWKCDVCGHEWIPRKSGLEPSHCPNRECRSRRWNSGRQDGLGVGRTQNLPEVSTRVPVLSGVRDDGKAGDVHRGAVDGSVQKNRGKQAKEVGHPSFCMCKECERVRRA